METLFTEAKRNYVAGKYKKALEIYSTILETEYNNAYAHQGLAQCLNRLGRLDEAGEECNRALEMNPELPIPYVILGGSVYFQQQHYEESEQALRKAIGMDPAFTEAYISLGATLAEQERFQEAVHALQQALELDQKSSITYYNLSVIYARQKDYRKALPEAWRAFRLGPSFGKAEWMILTAQGYLAEYRVLSFLFWLGILLLPYVTRSLLTAPLLAFTIWRITYGARSDLRSGRRARGMIQLALAVVSAVLYAYNLVYGLQLGPVTAR